jgi:hypothetical protein
MSPRSAGNRHYPRKGDAIVSYPRGGGRAVAGGGAGVSSSFTRRRGFGIASEMESSFAGAPSAFTRHQFGNSSEDNHCKVSSQIDCDVSLTHGQIY